MMFYAQNLNGWCSRLVPSYECACVCVSGGVSHIEISSIEPICAQYILLVLLDNDLITYCVRDRIDLRLGSGR